MIRVVKENVSKQPHSRNRAKKRSIHRFQPILIGAVFYEFFQHVISSGDQLPALFHVKDLTVVSLTHRRISYVRGDAEELTEQMHRFSDMPEDESNGGCFVIQPKRRIFVADPVKREMAGKLILLQHVEQDFFLHQLQPVRESV